MALRTSLCRSARAKHSNISFLRHFPKKYLENAEGTTKVTFDNRLGAPAISEWRRRPDFYVHGEDRPWESTAKQRNFDEDHERFKHKHLSYKKAQVVLDDGEWMSEEDWPFFVGDQVRIMVGADKGCQGTVNHVVRQRNWVFVSGMHMRADTLRDQMFMREYPLNVRKGEVKLLDPLDGEPLELDEIEWRATEKEGEWERVSRRTDDVIRIPDSAFATYEATTADGYVDGLLDTATKDVLKHTYEPVAATFEQEIMKAMNIKDDRKPPITYWY